MNKQKIVLIGVDSSWRYYGYHGLRYLSSVLKQKNYDVYMVFLNDYFSLSVSGFLQLLKICEASLFIGVSSMTPYKNRAIHLADILKKIDVPLIAGGLFPTLEPEEALNYFDYICIGEGERAILAFADSLTAGLKENISISNIWLNSENGIIKNECVSPIMNLDDLPPPDYLGDNHYIMNDNGSLEKIDISITKNLKMFSYITDRGCPFNCSYCHNNKIQRINKIPRNARIRRHSIGYIITNLIKIMQFYQFEFIWLQDDDFFNRDETEIIEFSKLWKKHIKKPFFILSTPFNLNERKTKILADAGLFQIIAGIQTGSRDIAKLYCRKYLNDNEITDLNRITEKLKNKIMFKYDFIILNPFETGNDIRATIKLIMKFKTPFYLSFNTLTFMPGTPLHTLAKRKISNIDETGMIQNTIYYRFTRLKNYDKNLYLNIILCLIGQKNNVFISGWIPRFMINFLISKRIVSFFDKRKELCRGIIFLIEKFMKKYYDWRAENYEENLQLPVHLIEAQKKILSNSIN